jgi:hypothetical protein
MEVGAGSLKRKALLETLSEFARGLFLSSFHRLQLYESRVCDVEGESGKQIRHREKLWESARFILLMVVVVIVRR